ncbi:hypothetical protein [Marinibacterium profundimaris]|uniref:Lipoprotein n=1 Tax=Marinibacterium profundimaris TaxID=1679460 RepID=A0A225NQ53_9RHOB|nr:hypothetical protein [Marinibacterium profundimaris]OWU73377.1 hypothetical protein ATO3_11850 [Marinibacterium profundimaris]
MRLTLTCVALLAALSACSAIAPSASDEEIAAVAFRNDGPASVTLMTVINTSSGSGAHSALLIDGPQRVIFDPAGSFEYDPIPERNDVLFGITPRNEQIYKSSHASEKRYIQLQTIPLTEEQAAVAYQTAVNWGASPAAHCTTATSGVLKSIPGLQSIQSTWYPRKLAEQVSRIPGVREEIYSEGGTESVQEAVAALDEELRQQRWQQ